MTEPTDPTTRSESTGPTEPAAERAAAEPAAERAAAEPAAEPASPAIPAPDDDRVAVLAAYLRTNEGKFTDEALAMAARAVGYSDAELAAARGLAGPSWQAPVRATREGPKRNNAVVAAVAIGYVIVLYVAISTAASASSDLSGTVGLVGLILGVVGWAVLRNQEPSIAQGLGCGVVLAVTIPIVVIVVILGICIVTGSFPTGP
jgi:hypothetical protein